MSKKLQVLVILLLTTTYSFSQFYKSLLPSPEFSGALEKIVLDFREDYKNIQGDLLDDNGETDVYESLVTLPGTTDCRIIRYRSVKDTTAGWQAIVYNGDDYKDAVKAYQNTFRLLRKATIKWIDLSTISFRGEMNPPRDDVRFTTSILQLDLADKRYENFEAQVELLSTFGGFMVQLSLHKKVKEELD